MSERDRWHWPAHVHPVLVVFDDEAIRHLLVETLESVGHPVVAAANGAAALEEVRRRCPALILLDLSMPVMDGRAFLGVVGAHTHPLARSIQWGHAAERL